MKYELYPLEAAEVKDTDEIMALYRMQIGSDYCIWDENYPSMELLDGDIAEQRAFVVRRDERIVAAISWDKDEEVDRLPCWDRHLQRTAEFARLCIHPEYQHRGLTCSLIIGSEERLKAEGYDGAHYIVSVNHKRALKAYEKFGYTLKGRVRLFNQEWFAYEKALK